MRGAADAYPFPTLPPGIRFPLALAAVALVFLACWAARDVIDDGSEFLLLGTAVMACAWFAGTGPALAATVFGALLGAYEARHAGTTDPAAPMHLALFVVQGLLLTAVVSEMRAARRNAEQQALAAQAARREGEAANRMKDEFLATVSHELRTPLNAVLGWVHLLRTGKLDEPTAARGLESIERNVRLQAQLTGDLLDVSKALTGQLQLDPHPTALGDAVKQALNAAEAAARAKDVHLNVSLPDSPVVILGDQLRLRQIAWHLLANAIKFTPRGGSVDLTLSAERGLGRLVVRDTGRGIDPQFLPRIFDRFTQADASATRAAGGLGVGLALVRELVELHGGEIEARNAPTGPGAMFTAQFPLQPAELLAKHVPTHAAIVHAATSEALNGLKVLVLDTNLESRELLSAVLQQRGASVRTVAAIAEALEALESWRPDVLVSDSGSAEHQSYSLIGKVQSLDAERGGRIPAAA
ncbi:MAG TPA: ATP-binding protein, partial [Planctomycetaceae bacterium]|nr:ATP-binding protein [Planctomycetaceae bacterium]